VGAESGSGESPNDSNDGSNFPRVRLVVSRKTKTTLPVGQREAPSENTRGNLDSASCNSRSLCSLEICIELAYPSKLKFNHTRGINEKATATTIMYN